MAKKSKKIAIFLSFVFFIFYSITSYIYQNSNPARGDEVHYLITASSIANDFDLDLNNNYEDKDYKTYFQGNLDRHTIITQNGKERLYHGMGSFQFLIAPFYKIGGRLLVMIFLSFVSSILINQIFKVSTKITKNLNLSLITTIFIGLNLPISQYSFLVFMEILAALTILLIFYRLYQNRFSAVTFLLLGFLPWIHLRFLPLSIVLLVFSILKLFNQNKSFRKIIPQISISILIISLYFLFSYVIYGFWDPSKSTRMALSNLNFKGNIFENFINILFDRQYGLFIFSPIYFFTIPGILLTYKKSKDIFFLILIIFFAYLFPVLNFYDWNGGYSPPARYLTPILGVATPLIVIYLSSLKKLWRIFFLNIFGIWGVSAFILNLTTNDGGFVFIDGISKFLIKLNYITGYNIQGLFPAFYPEKTLKGSHLVFIVIALIFLLFLRSKALKKEE